MKTWKNAQTSMDIGMIFTNCLVLICPMWIMMQTWTSMSPSKAFSSNEKDGWNVPTVFFLYDLSFGLKINAIMKAKKMEAAIPAEAAFTPPVNAPNNPIS